MMMKAILAGLAATASAKFNLDAHLNTMQHVYNKAVLNLSSSPNMPGKWPTSLTSIETHQVANLSLSIEQPNKFDGVACQYWWNNSWYNF